MNWRTLLCIVLNGEHEFYRVWTRDRLYQRCVLCGHETPGWDVRPSLRYWSTWMH